MQSAVSDVDPFSISCIVHLSVSLVPPLLGLSPHVAPD